MRNVTPKDKQKKSESSEQAPDNGVTIKPTSSKESGLAMLAHLLTTLGWFGLPAVNLIAPAAVWIFSRRKYPFAEDQAKESLNFQITMSVALLVSYALVSIGIGAIGLMILPFVNLTLVFIASIKSNKGVAYRYPWTIRLIS